MTTRQLPYRGLRLRLAVWYLTHLAPLVCRAVGHVVGPWWEGMPDLGNWCRRCRRAQ